MNDSRHRHGEAARDNGGSAAPLTITRRGPLGVRLVAALMLGVALTGCTGLRGGDGSPELQWLEGARPIYPAAAKAEGIEGSVTVEYRVTTTGAVEAARVVEAQPAGVFDAAALTAVRSWKYRPYERDGAVITVDGVRSTLEFRLGEAWQGL